ncbi:YjaG family protein [Ningiella sp. W23]|uniref:YjaG family protein n=1 Tax=Ningiella sp. W23 TaxID=3023715 RepID=UPI0037576580
MSKLTSFAQIRALDKNRALVLSTALIQRMLPNYFLFCEVLGKDRLTIEAHQASASNLVNLLWETSTNKAMKLNVDAQSEKLEEITPSTTEHDNLGVYAALDFCMALSAALQLIGNEDEQAAVTVAKLSQGSVERHIHAILGEEVTGEALKLHPLMQFELETLNEVLAVCQSKKLSSEHIKALRNDMREQGVSNLGIEC